MRHRGLTHFPNLIAFQCGEDGNGIEENRTVSKLVNGNRPLQIKTLQRTGRDSDFGGKLAEV